MEHAKFLDVFFLSPLVFHLNMNLFILRLGFYGTGKFEGFQIYSRGELETHYVNEIPRT